MQKDINNKAMVIMLVNVLLSKTHKICREKILLISHIIVIWKRSGRRLRVERRRRLDCAMETHHILAPVLCLSLAAA